MSIFKKFIIIFLIIVIFSILLTFLISDFIVLKSFNQGQKTRLITILIVSIIIPLFGLIIFLVINKLLLKRLKGLSDAVKNLGFFRDFKKRIYVEGNDELALLSGSINTMLDELDLAQNEMNKSEKKYHSLFDNSLDGIYISTTGGDYVDANPALVEMLGYDSREELLSINIPTQLYCSEKDRPRPEDRNRTFQTRLRKKDGTEIFVEISSRVIHEKEGDTYYQGIVRDITQRKRAEEKIKLLSFHDDLTGLYNRVYFEEELKRLDSERQLPLSLIIADINSLKLINDAFGHGQGDMLLKTCSRVFKECCRKEDIIARWGGDEFIMLMPLTTRENASKLIERIKSTCSNYKIENIPVSISMGVETKTEPGQDVGGILKEAEGMMYRNKLLERKKISGVIISSLQNTLLEKNHENRDHVGIINEVALRIGKAVNLSQNELKELVLLSSLHDLGKIAIPESILNKREKLTEKEWQLIKRHPEIGYNIAQSTPRLAVISEAILSHHERYDGEGYPQGLKGCQIPILSRIISIADTYAVMVAGRPYKAPLSKEEAMKEIKKGAGSTYDPELVRKFLEVMAAGD